MEMASMGSYGLEVVRVTSNGRRYYDPAGKARLVEACLEPGISVARLALEHGLNANQLRKWVRKYQQRQSANGQRSAGQLPDPSAFVRVETSPARAVRHTGGIASRPAGLVPSARLQASIADSDDAAHPFRSDRAHRSDLMPPGWGVDRGPLITWDISVGQAAWAERFRRMDSPESSSRCAL